MIVSSVKRSEEQYFIWRNNSFMNMRKSILRLSDHATYFPSKQTGNGHHRVKYLIPSVARELMARLPQLFRTRSRVSYKNPIAADFG